MECDECVSMNSYTLHLDSCGNLPSGEYFKKCESIYGGSQNFTILYSFRSGSIITFPSLKYTKYVSNLCGFMLNCYMKELYLPNLSQADCYGGNGVLFHSMPNVEIIYCPNMEYTGTYINEYEKVCGFAYNCPKLRYVCLGNLKGGRNIFGLGFNYCKSLIRLEIGEGTAINLPLYLWYPTDAIDRNSDNLVENADLFNDNLEQFLYNFRMYIINKVYNYTGGSRHTITLRKVIYNLVLGLDESGYANTFHMPDEPSIDYVTSLNQKLTDINWGLAYV